jgi:hypothetical protein
MIRGFDIDGVLLPSMKVPKPEKTDFIITGRSFHNAFKTVIELSEHMIYAPVYFNPRPPHEVNPQTNADWKATMIDLLGIEEFYEDDAYQVEVIRAWCPNVRVIHVV